MKILITGKEVALSQEVRSQIEDRIRIALSRFSPKVQQVSAVINDVNGPRGGIDKRCRITVQLRRLNDVTVTSEDSRVEASVKRAVDRIGRAVARAIERSRQFDSRQLV